MTIKIDTSRNLPVLLLDSSGVAVTGIVWNDALMSVEYAKEGDGTLSTFVVNVNNWNEIGQGVYEIEFTDSEIDTIGFLKYLVNATGAIQFNGLVTVSANLLDDNNTDINTRSPANEYDTEMSRVDVAVSSRSSHTAANVWSVSTRALTTFGTLIADIWASVARTLTAGTKDSEIDAIKAKTDNLPTDPTSETNATANKNEILDISQLGYWLNSFQTFTYDGSGRVQSVAVNIGSNVTPTKQYSISFTYNLDGTIATYNIEEV